MNVVFPSSWHVIEPVNAEFDREFLLVLRAATSVGFFSGYPEIQATLMKMDSFSARHRRRIVCVAENRVVAFADWFKHELDFLFVQPQSQRMGIGSAILLRQSTADTADLQTLCVKDNRTGLCFYKEHSFKIVVER